jgi:two-component system, chemotaxis family, sensor kinase CheA
MPELDNEMKEIIESFFIEVEELLDNLGQDLIKLDQGNSDPDLLNGIFRSVHTIKGTSSFLGLGK